MTTETIFRLSTFAVLAIAFGISGYFRRQADEGGVCAFDFVHNQPTMGNMGAV